MKNELQKHRILIICQSSQDRKSVSLSNFMYLGTWVYYSCSIMKINLVSKIKFNCDSICPYSFIILYIVILHYKSTALWCHTMCKITNHFKALSYTVNYISWWLNLWIWQIENNYKKCIARIYCPWQLIHVVQGPVYARLKNIVPAKYPKKQHFVKVIKY